MILYSSYLLECWDYRSVVLKCLTQRFTLFSFSLPYTLLKKNLVVLYRPHPWVCLESRRKKIHAII